MNGYINCLVQVFGHDKVSVLDGGLPRWKAEDLPTEQGSPSTDSKSAPGSEYVAEPLEKDLVKSYEEMVTNSKRNKDSRDFEIVMDARSKER